MVGSNFEDEQSTDGLETRVMPSVTPFNEENSSNNPFVRTAHSDKRPSEEDLAPTVVLPSISGTPGNYELEGITRLTELESFTALKEFDPKVSVSQMLAELEALDEDPPEEPKKPWPLIAGVAAGVMVVGIVAYGLVQMNSDDDVEGKTPVAATETAKEDKPEETKKGFLPEIFNQPTDKAEDKKDEAKEKKDEAKDKKEKVEEEDQEKDVPDEDAVSKLVRTPDGTEIVNFKDSNMVPYEKFTDKSKGQTVSDTLTGNNYNDEYQAFRMNLGSRHKGSLSPEQFPERQVRDSMTSAVEQSGLKIQVPDKPDYKTARLMSSGYSLWNISDGYVLVMADGQAKAIIAPGEKEDKLTDSAVNSSETMVPQRYADRYAVSFGTLNKTVGGSQNPADSPEEWQ